jgi:hypothetical protein
MDKRMKGGEKGILFDRLVRAKSIIVWTIINDLGVPFV